MNHPKHFKKTLLASCSALAMSQVGLTAQAEESASPRLEEIIVVAQRRSENLQDVPISVSAVRADDLSNFNINSAIELPKMVSALNVEQSAGSVNLYMRGIGNPTSAQGNEGSVATYVDGVYVPRLSPELLRLNNVDRVEVLKGPQGTLFGRNATAGVVHIITRDPTQETTVKTEVGYGDYEAFEGNLYASTGLTENLASDIAVRYEEQFDGWGNTVEIPADHPGYAPNPRAGQDFGEGWSVTARSKSVFTPSDSTKVTLIADYQDGRDNRGIFGTYKYGTNGQSFPPLGSYLFPSAGSRYDNIGNDADYASSEGWGLTLNLDHELPFADIISITSYHALEGTFRKDADYSPLTVFNFDGKFENDLFSQELRLQSNSDGPLSWTAGLYYMDFDVRYNPASFSGLQFQFVTGLPNGQLEGFAHQATKSTAGFAQATYEILPNTNLTLGGRYTVDEVDADGHTDLVDPVLGVRINTGNLSDSEDFEKFTYRVALDHRLTDDVMLYGSVSRGYKAGNYNILPLAFPAVKPEVLDAYEIGAKTELLDNRVRLNLAAFYWEASDLQVTNFTTSTITVLNAAEATSKGVEAELLASVSERLDIHGSITYTDAEYDSFPNAPIMFPNPNPPGGNFDAISGDGSGNRPPSAPKVKFNLGFSYLIPSEMGEFVVAANYMYRSKVYFNPDNLVSDDSIGLVDGNLSFSPAGYPGLKFTLWGSNLTDEEYIMQSTEQSGPVGTILQPSPPRMYGIRVGYEM